MTKGAYYNEINPEAAAWLRELIKQGHIADGEVDERSIEDVLPSEISGFTQCHFFAGIGVWSYALRRAGWADDRPVWTGSCPCQPFSAAGKGKGFADERHLWPAFFHLIENVRPLHVFGEQVASKDGLAWIDLVQADMEGTGYAFGEADTCAAGFGAPHIRQRLYWVADSSRKQHNGAGNAGQSRGIEYSNSRPTFTLAHTSDGSIYGGISRPAIGKLSQSVRALQAEPRSASPTNGLWRDADWLYCRDGKWRPVEARPQQMANGLAISLGYVHDSCCEKIEEEINAWSQRYKIDAREALHDLWLSLSETAPNFWPDGRLPKLYEAPFLLSFLRQLAQQGRNIAQGLPCTSAETSKTKLRELRLLDTSSCSSRGRELEEQQSEKSSNPLHILSSILARYTQEAWSDSYEAYAEIGFPLGNKSPARVGRLRGYGNAIVAAQAQGFIEAFMEIEI